MEMANAMGEQGNNDAKLDVAIVECATVSQASFECVSVCVDGGKSLEILIRTPSSLVRQSERSQFIHSSLDFANFHHIISHKTYYYYIHNLEWQSNGTPYIAS